MKRAAALACAVLAASAVLAAGPASSQEIYDFDAHSTNIGTSPPDTARNQGKFDPYTQGANTSTAAQLTDEGAAPTSAPAPKTSGKSHKMSSKKGTSGATATPAATQ